MGSLSQLSNVDGWEFMGISQNPDGSLNRPPNPTSPATPELISDSQLTLSKDVPLNPTNATFLRLFRPASPRTEKLPIIIYSHGGGFILNNANSAPMHNLCSGISAHSSALVISLEYRLAPEHRLPAAYDDGVDAIKWLHGQALKTKLEGRDEWLTEIADFSNVYLMGSSAGGNLTYTVALRALDLDLYPIKIVGIIFDQPFFGGVERSESELRLEHDEILPLVASDLSWSLALPLGSNRDHEYCNPFGDRHRFLYQKIKQLQQKCLIRFKAQDPLVDRQKQFAKLLESLGVHVTTKLYEKGKHTTELMNPDEAQVLYDDVKAFIAN